MSPELEQSLFIRFPKIFLIEIDGQPQSSLRFGIECDDGWYRVINSLCAFIQQHIDERQIEQVKATAIKEKFAVLRFSYSNGDNYVRDLVSIAAGVSMRTCTVCGNSGTQFKTKEKWVLTRCEEHARPVY